MIILWLKILKFWAFSILLCVFIVCLTGCQTGNKIDIPETEYSLILNNGSMFAYSLKTLTLMFGICSGDGITPRLNADGTYT